jgi:regulator of RNase E activity RraB
VNDIAVADQIAAHEARNRELLKTLVAKGVDLAALRSVELFFVARSEAQAVELAVAIKSRNLGAVRVDHRQNSEPAWFVSVQAHASPESACGSEFTRAMVRLAQSHGADYDGWGTEV